MPSRKPAILAMAYLLAKLPRSALARDRGSHELAQLGPVEILELAELDVAVHPAGPLHQSARVRQTGAVGDAQGHVGPLRRDREVEALVAGGGAEADGGAETRVLGPHRHHGVGKELEHRLAGAEGDLTNRRGAGFHGPFHVAVHDQTVDDQLDRAGSAATTSAIDSASTSTTRSASAPSMTSGGVYAAPLPRRGPGPRQGPCGREGPGGGRCGPGRGGPRGRRRPRRGGAAPPPGGPPGRSPAAIRRGGPACPPRPAPAARPRPRPAPRRGDPAAPPAAPGTPPRPPSGPARPGGAGRGAAAAGGPPAPAADAGPGGTAPSNPRSPRRRCRRDSPRPGRGIGSVPDRHDGGGPAARRAAQPPRRPPRPRRRRRG